MPRRNVPTRCSNCGSSRMFLQQIEMLGSGTKGYRFDAYICEVCKYSQLYYKGSGSPINQKPEATVGPEIRKDTPPPPPKCKPENSKA